MASCGPPHQPRPSQSGSLQAQPGQTLIRSNIVQKLTCTPPTNTDLDVVAIGGVFEVVDGAHHVQRHVTDVVSVILGLLRSPGDHHVGVPDRLHLQRAREGGEGAAVRRQHSPIEVHERQRRARTDLEDAVLLAERVEQRVHGVEHGHHLHRSDVAADASESHHVAEQDGHVRENLGE